MLKTGDFATRCGVTKRHIDRLLKRHEDDLIGHFERREAGGTFLDEYAQDFLRGKLRNPLEILPSEEELDPRELKAEIDELRKDLVTMSKMLASAEIAARENAGTAALLEASDTEKKRLQKERDDLLIENTSQKTQNAHLSADNAKLGLELAEAKKTAQNASDELTRAKKQFEDEKHLLEQAITGMKKANLWQRIKGWKE